MRLFDSHSHINGPEFDADRPEVLARMHEAGLEGAMVVACDYGKERRECTVDEIIAICRDPRIRAVGETGLDYHWCKGDLAWQKNRFARHIEAAKILGKPVIVHAREAESDALDILSAHDAGSVGFVMHCFGGTIDDARRTLDLGGLLTFKSARGLRDIAAQLPLDRMMVETDCPYMAPVPYRGKRCEPAFVTETAKMLALLKGVDPEEAAAVTTDTARRFFKL